MNILVNVILWTAGFLVFCAIFSIAGSLYRIAELLQEGFKMEVVE